MATDVDVQYFSHLNGLTLGNNWGDLIRLLDKALVTGIDFTQITTASIDAQGDVHITLYAAHNAMLFQVVELSGFAPASLNQKYRIKGVPSATQLILKPHTAIVETSITTVGTGKLASLGYEIIFRDTNDVKRVYRAKSPRSEHPFIRVDETISNGTNRYNSAYAKSAMVGLIENMTHIDDYQDTGKLQLPLKTADFKKNWKITGTGSSVVRGWSKWYWAKGWEDVADSSAPATGNRSFTLCGNKDAFYLLRSIDTSVQQYKTLLGCGLYDSTLDSSVVPNWFLMTKMLSNTAGTPYFYNDTPDGNPLMRGDNFSCFYVPTYNVANRIISHTTMNGTVPDQLSGFSAIYSANNVSALQIPVFDANKYLRGNLKYVHYAGNNRNTNISTTPVLTDNSMYVWDSAYTFSDTDAVGGFYFYLGELE